MRAGEFANSKLVIFDIDDTLVNTDTRVNVVKDGKIVKRLNSHDFTHYKLEPGEEFDFGAFRDAREFFANARPIAPMIRQLKQDIATGNKVIMVTARADFNDRDIFLSTFEKWGIDMSKVHVYRAGNIQMKVATEEKKKIILRHLLGKTHYDKVIMYDDAVPNLDAFLSLAQEYPWSKFYAWHVDREGGATEYHRSGITETIRKIGANRWRLYSKDGSRNLGTFDSLAAAKKHEQEVQAFKHMKENQSKPVRAYHGNQGGIDTEQLHAPMWFTASRPDAEHYAGDDGYVVVVDLDITNPYRLRPGEEANTVLRRWQELQAQGYDGIYDRRLGDWIPFTRKQIRVISKDDVMKENFADGKPVIDMLEEGSREISRWLEENPALLESKEGWSEIKSLFDRITGNQPAVGKNYAVLNLVADPPGRFLLQQGSSTPATLIDIIDRGSYQQYEFDMGGQRVRYPEDHRAGDRLSKTFVFQDPVALEKTQTLIALSLPGWEIRNRLSENFADGKVKGKSRPGRVKRAGASCKGSVTDLRAKARKYGGERGKMYHWCANMKAGKKK